MRRAVLAGVLLGALAAADPRAARADGPGSAAARNNEGNRLYEQKRYDEALKSYMDAQARRPDAPELHYNIGNVLYRKGQFDKAVEEYVKAQAAPDPALAQAAVFNRGNALLMQRKLPDAIGAYVQALRARPDDADAKRNLELALRLLEEQKKKEREQRDSQDQEAGDQGDSQQPPAEPRPTPRDDPSGSRRPQPGSMSEEEARQVLEALKEEERAGIRKHARAAIPERRDPEKDW